MAVLLAVADPAVVFEIVADQADVAQDLPGLAADGQATDRRGQAPLLDKIRLADAEVETARAKIETAVAEFPGIDPMRDGGDDLGGGNAPGLDIGGEHARLGDAAEILQAGVPPVPEAQQPLVGVVADKAAQDPLLDQERRRGSFALIIDSGVPEERVALIAAEDGDRSGDNRPVEVMLG